MDLDQPILQTEQDVRRDLDAARVDTFLELAPDGTVTLFAGKVELGTGVATALAQIVAGELGVPVGQVHVVMGDTARTLDQGTTAGSKTIQVAGPVIRRAAMIARETLLGRAAARMEVAPADLEIVDGFVRPVDDSSRGTPLGDLATGPFAQEVGDDPPGTMPPPSPLTGTSVPRLDLPGKLTGAPAYVHDLMLPGMIHGRVVRPMRRLNDGVGAEIVAVDDAEARKVPGVVGIVRNGSFLGVVTEREEQAIRAAEALRVTWSEPAPLMPLEDYHRRLPELVAEEVEIARAGDPETTIEASARSLSARYTFPLQAHASLGPSCAVADVHPDRATVWSSTQGPYALRNSLAPLLGLEPHQVRVVFREGAGCYGQNGADDVAADAALLSQAVGCPVRVQWLRQEEFAWEPKGAGMVVKIAAALAGDGALAAWDYDVWTPTHAQRPSGQPGHLLAGQQIHPPMPQPPPRYVGGDRDAATTYAFPELRTTVHWAHTAPLRVSSLRSLGGIHNATATELFVDELAQAAGIDSVAFRLRHLDDPRAAEVVERAASAAGWADPLPAREGALLTGRGIAYSRYEGAYAYVATVAEVAVDPETGDVRVTRVVVAHDCGRITNPDGVSNQVEGQVIQGISRALTEQVTWDDREVTSLTWAEYPILRYSEVPEIEIVLIDRPEETSFGAGEPTICTVPPAVGNAIAAATGARLRDLPFTPERVRAGIVTRP